MSENPFLSTVGNLPNPTFSTPVQKQPQPTPGVDSVTPVAHEEFNHMLNAAQARGIKTYGITLQTWNGRDVTRDLKEELVDAFQYACQAEMEREDMQGVLTELSDNLQEVTRIMELQARIIEGDNELITHLLEYLASNQKGNVHGK